ncbi:hypothetical protein HQ545_03695 [Candidatus Woesearchaeota archaeon]|nr:hypothetical protein [Candidatus Woesearchaeota archaeon]
MTAEYCEETTRYTSSDIELHFRFYPHKMSAYGLAKSLHFHGAQKRDKYKDLLVGKFSGYIDEMLDLQSLQSEMPSEEQVRQHSSKVDVFKAVFCANLDNLLEDIFKDGGNKSGYTLFDAPLKYVERKTNQAIFNVWMQNTIQSMVNSKAVNAVCEDYALVQDVKHNPGHFGVLEKKCASALYGFVTRKQVLGVDRECQYQEGLLTIWACTQLYEGRNFARFTTMVKKALQFKFLNMLRYSMAYKRKVNRFTSPLGSATNPDESYLARKLDSLTCDAWVSAQRIQDQLPDGLHNPFSSFSLCETIENRINGYAVEWDAVFKKGRIPVDETNFPHLNEKKIIYAQS